MCFEFDVHTGFGARFIAPSFFSKKRNVRRTKPRDRKIHTYRENIGGHLNGVCQITTALSNMAVPTQTDVIISSQNQTMLFLTSMRNIGAIHISSKYAVSPRDQTTYNRRVSGTMLK